MLGLPRSTEVNRRVPKEKLYANAALTPQLRDMIKSQIESVTWRNKLAESTIGIGSGESVNEIQVFEMLLRQRGLDRRILPVIARAIPYKILFFLVFDGEVQAWMEASGTFYNTGWLPLDGFMLKVEGLDLDAVYANMVRQVAGGRLGSEGGIDEAVARDKRRREVEREIAVLEKRLVRERQFNRQVEMSGELKGLKKELEGSE